LNDLLKGIGVRPGSIRGEAFISREAPVPPVPPDQPTDRPERGVGVVAGRVTGAGSAAATLIPEAKVTAIDAATGQGIPVDTRNGEFKMRLPAGKYVFTATAEGFETVSQDVELAPDATVELAFRLKKASAPPVPPDQPTERGAGVIVGRVTGAGSAATTPIPEAKVTAIDAATRRSIAVTVRNGEFKMRLPAGKYVFTALADGFESVTQDVELAPDATVEVAFRLKKAR
jgi:antitoxin component of MazEF toxin-antitoxin module